MEIFNNLTNKDVSDNVIVNINSDDYISLYLKRYFFIEDNDDINSIFINPYIKNDNNLNIKYKFILDNILDLKSNLSTGSGYIYKMFNNINYNKSNIVVSDLIYLNLWYFLYPYLKDDIFLKIEQLDNYKLLLKEKDTLGLDNKSYNTMRLKNYSIADYIDWRESSKLNDLIITGIINFIVPYDLLITFPEIRNITIKYINGNEENLEVDSIEVKWGDIITFN